MAELDFERRLERLFSDPPYYSDAEAFAVRVERRLDRGWTVRRGLIGVAGLAGGVVGARQLILSSFMQRVESASEGSAKVLSTGWTQLISTADLLSGLPVGSLGMWGAAGLALLAMAFVVSRLIEEF